MNPLNSTRRIFLVRHCKASGQEAEAELTREGVSQSVVLSQFLHKLAIEYIVSSPFQRAISTIEPFSEISKLNINIDARLSERVLSPKDEPNWIDRLKDTFENLEIKLPGGESSLEAMNRGIKVIEELLTRDEKNIVIVTHGNLMSLMLKYYDQSYGFKEWKGLSNPDVYELCQTDKSTKIKINRLWEND